MVIVLLPPSALPLDFMWGGLLPVGGRPGFGPVAGGPPAPCGWRAPVVPSSSRQTQSSSSARSATSRLPCCLQVPQFGISSALATVSEEMMPPGTLILEQGHLLLGLHFAMQRTRRHLSVDVGKEHLCPVHAGIDRRAIGRVFVGPVRGSQFAASQSNTSFATPPAPTYCMILPGG